ncbi:MAG: hypothetical protein AB1414_01265 [bacterium]
MKEQNPEKEEFQVINPFKEESFSKYTWKTLILMTPMFIIVGGIIFLFLYIIWEIIKSIF